MVDLASRREAVPGEIGLRKLYLRVNRPGRNKSVSVHAHAAAGEEPKMCLIFKSVGFKLAGSVTGDVDEYVPERRVGDPYAPGGADFVNVKGGRGPRSGPGAKDGIIGRYMAAVSHKNRVVVAEFYDRTLVDGQNGATGNRDIA
jgi:hypothetical protein